MSLLISFFLVFVIILPNSANAATYIGFNVTALNNSARAAAKFVVANNCPYTVWAAVLPGGGRQLDSGESWDINVPSGTTQGRIWGRTNCMFDAKGTGKCQTGDCNGLLQCQGDGNPPKTLAEFALDQTNDLDFFDMSLVDGFNLPMEFGSTSGGCKRVINCTADINGKCPTELKAPGGCNGPCSVFNTSQYCCNDGSCEPTDFSRYFKERCPDAYSYPKDDATSVFTCPSNGTNYKVVFCPSDSETLIQLPEAPSSPPLLQPSWFNEVKKPISKRPIIIIGIASGICVLLAVVVAVFVLIYRNKAPQNNGKDERRTKDRVDAHNFIRTYRPSLLSSYSYKDIKKMSGGFKEKIGEGGYGKVYKGKALDGRLVAVKVLDKSGSEGQDFINEVAAVGKIHHHNIIKLFGFCLEGKKIALVYEYMPNGSLADLLSKQKEESQSLRMAKLLEIAIGIGHGIEYLHVGCDSRILHLDIKPQNVLLDQNLVPKISDFGLAKIYSRQKSAVTVTGLKGTYGFIAPEIFMRNLGNPSHKSDVYSFGMLLLEMVGGRDRPDDIMKANASSSSESYFPGWIFSKLNQEEISIEDPDSAAGEDSLASRKMLMVGIWCIQVNPRDRPSMPTVVDMLSGSVETIGMPPKPVFSSPPPSKLPSPGDGDDETNNSRSLSQDNFGSSELNVDDDTRRF